MNGKEFLVRTFSKALIYGAIALSTIIIVGVNSPTSALAAKKPAGSKPASKELVTRAIAGKSWKWSSKDGAHFARNGKFSAIWEGTVALGDWTVTDVGTLCHDATWYKDDNGVVGERYKICFEHVVAPDGNLWQNDPNHGWKHFPKKGLYYGDWYRSKIARQKKKLGL